MQMNTPQYFHHWCLCPQDELPPPPQENLKYQQVGHAQAPMKLLPLLWDLVCVRFCVHPLSEVSVSPSPVELLQLSPTGLQSQILWGLFLMSDLQTGSLICGSELSHLWKNFCDIILQFVGHPPRVYGIWLYHECAPPTVLLWLLLYVFGCRIFFGSFQFFLSMVVQQLVVVLVCLWEEVSSRSFYSAILSRNWKSS